MSKLMKFIWTLISMVPLIIVFGLVLLFDYFWKRTLCITWIIPVILLSCSILLIIICYAIIIFALSKLSTIKLKVEEIESKDSFVASNIITYLLPLATITVESINWVAFIGLMAILFVLLFSTKIVQLNPIMFLFRYRYYTIKASSGIKYTLISKKKRMDIESPKVMIEIFPEIYMEVEDKNV